MAYLARMAPYFIQPGPFGPDESYVSCVGAYAVVYDEEGVQVTGNESQFMPMAVVDAAIGAADLGSALKASLAQLLGDQASYTGDLNCEWVPQPVFPAPV